MLRYSASMAAWSSSPTAMSNAAKPSYSEALALYREFGDDASVLDCSRDSPCTRALGATRPKLAAWWPRCAP